MSGPDVLRVAGKILRPGKPLRARHATLARVIDVRSGGGASRGTAEKTRSARVRALDRVVVVWFRGPRSYTGEDVVEISAHGSPVLLGAIVGSAIAAGARLARRGEFTLRAFLNGRLDLVQAEAVADLVNAVTPVQATVAFDQLDGTLTGAVKEIHEGLFGLIVALEASLDFPEQGYHFGSAGWVKSGIGAARSRMEALLAGSGRGRLIREGRRAVIVGKANVGKSSLFNALVGSDRAIVRPESGTTRDVVGESVEIGGVPVLLVDTAGVRAATDPAEAEGVARARAAAGTADLNVVVLDGSRSLDEEDRVVLELTREGRRVLVANKRDVGMVWGGEAVGEEGLVRVSAKSGDGVVDLKAAVLEALGGGVERRECPSVSNIRHIEAMGRARGALERADGAVDEGASEEFVLADLQEARAALEEVTGVRTAEDVVAAIFERFCIGK